MAVTETIKSSAYRVWDAASSAWKKYSFWTQASDTVYTDGNTAQVKNGAINGITSSLASTATDIAASASTVNTLNNNLSKLGGFTPVIDETTGKITGYKTAAGGADTVFPFSPQTSASGVVVLPNDGITQIGTISLGFKPICFGFLAVNGRAAQLHYDTRVSTTSYEYSYSNATPEEFNLNGTKVSSGHNMSFGTSGYDCGVVLTIEDTSITITGFINNQTSIAHVYWYAIG